MLDFFFSSFIVTKRIRLWLVRTENTFRSRNLTEGGPSLWPGGVSLTTLFRRCFLVRVTHRKKRSPSRLGTVSLTTLDRGCFTVRVPYQVSVSLTVGENLLHVEGGSPSRLSTGGVFRSGYLTEGGPPSWWVKTSLSSKEGLSHDLGVPHRGKTSFGTFDGGYLSVKGVGSVPIFHRSNGTDRRTVGP